MALAAMLGSSAVEADEEEQDNSITSMLGDCAAPDESQVSAVAMFVPH